MFEVRSGRGSYTFNGSPSRAGDGERKSTAGPPVNGAHNASLRAPSGTALGETKTEGVSPASRASRSTSATQETNVNCKSDVGNNNNNNLNTSNGKARSELANKYSGIGNGPAVKSSISLNENSVVRSSSAQARDYAAGAKVNTNGKPVSQSSVSDRSGTSGVSSPIKPSVQPGIARELFARRRFVVVLDEPVCWDNEDDPIPGERLKEILSRIERALRKKHRKYGIEIGKTGDKNE